MLLSHHWGNRVRPVDPSIALIACAINSAHDDTALEVGRPHQIWDCGGIVANPEISPLGNPQKQPQILPLRQAQGQNDSVFLRDEGVADPGCERVAADWEVTPFLTPQKSNRRSFPFAMLRVRMTTERERGMRARTGSRCRCGFGGNPKKQVLRLRSRRRVATLVPALHALFGFHPIQSSSQAHVARSVRSLGGAGVVPLGNATGLPR